MTDGAPRTASEDADPLRDLLRRCGHELRNAQNAAAVNLEVVRSRVAAGKSGAELLQRFAENAATGLEDSARLTEEFVVLCGAIAAAFSSRQLDARERGTSGGAIELPLPEEAGRLLESRVATLARRVGFDVEPGPSGVILRIPPVNETNRA